MDKIILCMECKHIIPYFGSPELSQCKLDPSPPVRNSVTGQYGIAENKFCDHVNKNFDCINFDKKPYKPGIVKRLLTYLGIK